MTGNRGSGMGAVSDMSWMVVTVRGTGRHTAKAAKGA